MQRVPGVKLPDHEADYWSSSYMTVKDEWSFTSASSYDFMTWKLVRLDTLPEILLPQRHVNPRIVTIITKTLI